MKNGEGCTKNDQSKVNPIPLQGSVNSDEKDEEKLIEIKTEEIIPLFHEILEISEENIDQIFNKIKETPQLNDIIHNFLEYALKIRPKQSRHIKSLLSKIRINILPKDSCIKELQPRSIQKFYGAPLLFLGGSVERAHYKQFNKFYGAPLLFVEGSVEKAIKDDSVDQLIKLSANSDFDPKRKLNADDILDFVTGGNKRRNIHSGFNTKISYMQLMAFFGSINCFKYALLDGSFEDEEEDLSKYAVAGGNVEIIHLLEHKGVSFDNCFEVSVKYHRNDISEWLLKNYKCEKIKLLKAVEYFNMNAFLYLFKNGASDSKKSVQKAMLLSAKTGNLPLIKYIFETCNEFILHDDLYDNWGLILIYYLVKYNNLETLKYVLNSGKISDKDLYNNICFFDEEFYDLFEDDDDNRNVLFDDDAEDDGRKGGNALHFAVDNSNTQMIDFLIGKGFGINSTTSGDGGRPENDRFGFKNTTCGSTSLHIAVSKNDFHMVKYLVEKYGADIDFKDALDRTPLTWAIHNENKEIAQYLVDKGADTSVTNIWDENLLSYASDNMKEYVNEIMKKKKK